MVSSILPQNVHDLYKGKFGEMEITKGYIVECISNICCWNVVSGLIFRTYKKSNFTFFKIKRTLLQSYYLDCYLFRLPILLPITYKVQDQSQFVPYFFVHYISPQKHYMHRAGHYIERHRNALTLLKFQIDKNLYEAC